MRAQFNASFPGGAFKNIHWYPAIPPGLEEIEGADARPRQGGRLKLPATPHHRQEAAGPGS